LPKLFSALFFRADGPKKFDSINHVRESIKNTTKNELPLVLLVKLNIVSRRLIMIAGIQTNGNISQKFPLSIKKRYAIPIVININKIIKKIEPGPILYFLLYVYIVLG